MSAQSSIEWTDRTWNPVRGCRIVSPGCVNCYAMKQAHRFSGAGKPYEGLTKVTSQGPQWTGAVKTVESALLEPLSWRQRQRVFVNSMSDLFHEDVPDEFIDQVFAVMALADHHTFQVLTKRPQRMYDYLTDADRVQRTDAHVWALHTDDTTNAMPYDGVLENVWLGVSVEDQARANERIPQLLRTPAAVRFISAEPLLGLVRLDAIRWDPEPGGMGGPAYVDVCKGTFCTIGGSGFPGPRLDWVIVGGESGPGVRPCDVKWVRSIVRQCQQSDVPVFVKQLGGDVRDRNDAGFLGEEPDHWPDVIDQGDRIEYDLDGTRDGYQGAPVRIHLADRKGGDMAEWPEDLRVREFPS